MIEIFFTLILITICNIKSLNAFSAECPITHLDESVIRPTQCSNCLSLIAYYQSQGQNPQIWCQNAYNYQLCCLTCQNYQQLVINAPCVDIAYTKDCELKRQQGLCNLILGNNLPVYKLCAKTCNVCPPVKSYLTCEELGPNKCQQADCSEVILFNVTTIQCRCPIVRGGTYCQLENPCLSNPCQNGGKCHPSYESSVVKYSCECSKDYSGLQCQILNQCYPQYCLNGGQCRLNYVGAPYCVCKVGYYGIYCQDYIGTCSANTCLNNGRCQPLPNNDFICICSPNYSGKTCNFFIAPSLCYRGDINPSQCQIWKSSNLCNFIYIYQNTPIPLYCPISCDLCPNYPQCVDSNPNCPNWANLGLCIYLKTSYPNLCRRSCNCC